MFGDIIITQKGVKIKQGRWEMVFIISETLIIFLLVYIIAKLKVEIEVLQGKIIGLKMQIAFQRYFSNKKKNRIKKKSIKTFRYKNYQVKK